MRYLLIFLFAGMISLTNTTVNFEKQTAPMYQASESVYELPTKVSISSIQFYVESNMDFASSILFKIHDGNRTIYSPMKKPNVNKLINLSITNLWIQGPRPISFEDIQYTFQNAIKVSVHFVRHGSPSYQEFHIKNLTIEGSYEPPLNPEEDTDGDGMINAQEYIAGTDPLDLTSILVMNINRNGSNIIISWTSVSNKYYDLNKSTNLPDFYILKENILATPPINYFYDPISTGKHFYRVQVK